MNAIRDLTQSIRELASAIRALIAALNSGATLQGGGGGGPVEPLGGGDQARG